MKPKKATESCICADDATYNDDSDTTLSLVDDKSDDGEDAEGKGDEDVSLASDSAKNADGDSKIPENPTMSQLYYGLQWPDEDLPAPTNGDGDDLNDVVRPRRRSSISGVAPLGAKQSSRFENCGQRLYYRDSLPAPGAPSPPTAFRFGGATASIFSASEPKSIGISATGAKMESSNSAEGNGAPKAGRTDVLSAALLSPVSIGALEPTIAAHSQLDSLDVWHKDVEPQVQPRAIPERPRSPTPAELVAMRAIRQNSFMAQQLPDVRPQSMSAELQAILLPPADPRDRIFRITGRRSSSSTGNAPPMPSSRVMFPAPTLWRDNWKGDYGYSRL